jgi:hypothetical protein
LKRGPRKIPAHRARAQRRRIGQIFRPDPDVVPGDLLREREVGLEARQHGRGGEATRRKFCGLVQEIAARDLAVGVIVEKRKNFRGKIAGLASFHFGPPQVDRKIRC